MTENPLKVKTSFEKIDCMNTEPVVSTHINYQFRKQTSQPITALESDYLNSDETLKTNQNNYFYYQPVSVDTKQAYSITVSHFENAKHFYVQIFDWFSSFDQIFDNFQAECSSSKLRLENWTFLDSIENLEKLALAALFDEDNLWYRARIISRISESHALIEFVDYGNRQLTKFDRCVLLNDKFAKFNTAAVKCCGVAYLEGEIDLKLTKSLLCHFKVNYSFLNF